MIDRSGLGYFQGTGIAIGYVPEIHGPESQSQMVEVTRHEVGILVRYYLEEIAYAQTVWALGQVGSDDSRMHAFACRRISAFIEAGIVTEEQVKALAAEVIPSRQELQQLADAEERRHGVADDDSAEDRLIRREEQELEADLGALVAANRESTDAGASSGIPDDPGSASNPT